MGRQKVPSRYFLDSSLSVLSFAWSPLDDGDALRNRIDGTPNDIAMAVEISNIQVVCPASDFIFFFDEVEAQLDQSERMRAVLLQYINEMTGDRRRICFLEESEDARDKFVHAITALWLE